MDKSKQELWLEAQNLHYKSINKKEEAQEDKINFKEELKDVVEEQKSEDTEINSKKSGQQRNENIEIKARSERIDDEDVNDED